MSKKIVDCIRIEARPELLSGNIVYVRISVEHGGKFKEAYDIQLDTDMFESHFDRIMKQATEVLARQLKEVIIDDGK
jgi:hypothetical protein